MDDLIHILHLEDDPLDAELVQDSLAKSGLTCRIILAQTRAEFEHTLRKGRSDLVLADYRLPMYDGMSALQLTLELCPDIPFIFVSGTMGEEAAIEALTHGATDYVLKDNLSRLAPAVRRALQEALNLHERRQAQEALQRSNDLLRAIIEAVPVAILGLDLDGRVHSVWNPTAERMLGWRTQEVMGRPLPTVPEEKQAEFRGLLERIRNGEPLNGVEVRRQRRDGTPIDYSIYASPLHDTEGRISGNITVLVDITERKISEARTRKALHEKEILLREIHHRVKNNLAVISSLLNLQAKNQPEGNVQKALYESQSRVRSMALIHESLYQSENLSAVHFEEYVGKLIRDLLSLFRNPNDRIVIDYDIQTIELDIGQAIASGLIINELVTNALKYAFVGKNQGNICVKAKMENDSDIQVTIEDDGIGLPPGLDRDYSHNLGLRVVDLMVDQLHGSWRITSRPEGGVSAVIQWNKNLP